MKTKKILSFLILLSLPFMVTASSDDHGDHPFDWSGFWGWTINATILFGGLIFIMRKPLVRLLSQKSLDIKNDIINREKEIETTSRDFEKIKNRLESIEKEVQEMKKIAEKSGQDEKNRIEILGKKEAEKILSLTEAEINNRVESSINKLKVKIADLTIDHFKKDMGDRLDEDTHRRIIDKNIEISGDIVEAKEKDRDR
jgi:F0F1-type ATP synthase membrane subunit b/b'